MIREIIKSHFPYDTFNPGQYEAIKFAVDSFLEGKKHVILQAPTGIGKSAIATTVHRVLREIKGNWRTTIITATKGLQDQYEQEDSDIYSLKGKTNYPCPIGRDYYTGQGCRVARGEGLCDKPQDACTYLKRRVYWCKVAPLRLTNTSFQVNAADMLVIEPDVRANLIVVDECHDVDEQLVNHSALEIDIEKLQHLKKVTKVDFVNKFSDFINAFMEIEKGHAFELNDEMRAESKKLLDSIDAKIEELEEFISKNKKNSESQVGAVDELSSIRDKLAIFANHKGEWLVYEFEFSAKFTAKPVYAYQVSDYGLFRKSDHFLHMSATICGFDSYKFTLGITDEESACLDIANPIPVNNRKVLVLPRVKVSGDFDRGRWASLIDKIIDRHDGQNGVIHTVSFTLAKELQEYSRHDDRMVISNNREEILDLLTNHKNKIVLSPSVEKGYDFKGDMCRWQIIAKVPYGFIGDPWISLNMNRDSKWYSRKAILRIVQASGRAVRGVNDYATTYIVDQNFERLHQKNKTLFPSWYNESLEFKE